MTFELSSLGWDDHFATAYRRFVRPDQYPARVTRIDRGVCSVLGADGALRASVGGGVLAAARVDPVRLPCAGDWVAVRAWPDERITVEAVLRRRTALIRAGTGLDGADQLLAANVDAVGVVAAVDSEPDIGRIERLLAMVQESGATPVIVLTRIDLFAHPDPIVADVSVAAPGIAVCAVSATGGQGLDSLRPWVAAGRTLGLVGAPGAGKSALVHALAGATVMGTRSGRRADGRGRPATTCQTLVVLPGGGMVLDTPGIQVVDGVVRSAPARLVAVARSRMKRDHSQTRGHGAAEPG